MPSEIGGKKFVSDFKSMIEKEIASALDAGRTIIREATTELKDAISEQSRGAARVIREQAQHIRDEMGEFTGNNPPDEEPPPEGEKQTIKTDEVGKLDPTLLNSGGGTAS